MNRWMNRWMDTKCQTISNDVCLCVCVYAMAKSELTAHHYYLHMLNTRQQTQMTPLNWSLENLDKRAVFLLKCAHQKRHLSLSLLIQSSFFFDFIQSHSIFSNPCRNGMHFEFISPNIDLIRFNIGQNNKTHMMFRYTYVNQLSPLTRLAITRLKSQ